MAVFFDCDSTGTNIKSSGHVTFVYGKISETIYAVLGGNQGDRLKISPYDCSGTIFYSYGTTYKKFVCFLIPKNYIIKEEDKLQVQDKYSSADKANKKIFNTEVKTTKGESSR